jgi:hypothetical protein
LHVDSLSKDAVLNVDRSEIRYIDADGKEVDLGLGDPLVVRKNAPDSEAPIYNALKIRRDVYDKIKNQPVRLEINYSFTVLRLAASEVLPAVGADLQLPLIGRCSTRVDESETLIEVRCLKPGSFPSCLTATLEHAPSGLRNPESSFCEPDYSPYFGFAQYGPDALGRRAVTLRFRYSDESVHYPVSGQLIRESRVRFCIYEPKDQFKTTLAIPQIILGNWQAQ